MFKYYRDVFLIVCALAIALPAICHGADVFYLTNTIAHTNYGPFEYVHGGKVTVGNQSLEIRRLLTADERVIFRLQNIIVPEIPLRGVPLKDMAAFFQSAAREYERGTSADDGTNSIRFAVEGRPGQEVPRTENKELDRGMRRPPTFGIGGKKGVDPHT